MNEWVVIEIYRDGGKWKHYACCEKRAGEIEDDLKKAHPGRTYSVERVNPEGGKTEGSAPLASCSRIR